MASHLIEFTIPWPDSDDSEWEPEEEEHSESEMPAEEHENMLPEDVRTAIDRVFAGESYSPMMFVRSEHERMQQRMLPHERIAHQLRGYNDDNPLHVDDEMTVSSEFPQETNANRPRMNSELPRKRVMFHTLCQREQSGKTSNAQLIKLQETFMPFQENKHCNIVDCVRDRLYCGGFNSTGTRFLTAGQRSGILLYDTINWKRCAELPVRDVHWTVTDAKFTPDDKDILYATINVNVRMVSVNYDQTHREEVFCLSRSPRGSAQRRNRGDMLGRFFSRFGVWCLDINASGTEFVAGTSNNGVVLCDMQTNTPTCHVAGHEDDVNAIAFVDGPLHTNVFVSGSDDSLIKLWDRRVLSDANPKPQGVFPGHTDGLTHISSRDDGYYFISNAKDQSCKLWDIRKCFSAAEHDELLYFRKPYAWDYRCENYPGRNRLPVEHPQDKSVMTYRGHTVTQTLIRCYFSPLHSTAQKYIYTGSADGRVYVYDSITADLVEIFSMKPNGITRDVRWHPYDPTIVSPDFYGKLCVWQRQG